MRKVLALFVGLFTAVLISGCSGVMSPLTGQFYTDVQGGVTVGPAAGSSKVGEAKATGILGFATGDASITTAMKNGGITKVHHVDMKVKSILMVYVEYTTTVYGE